MNNLDGKWRVTVTSGPRWFRRMNWIPGKDRKYISGGSGYNRAMGKKWGPFDISRDEKCGWIVFTYTGRWRIVDKVWFVAPDKLKGCFYCNDEYVGYFTMERIL